MFIDILRQGMKSGIKPVSILKEWGYDVDSITLVDSVALFFCFFFITGDMLWLQKINFTDLSFLISFNFN